MADTIAAATKPIVAIVVGRSAPRGRVMGHAGALVGRDRDTAQAKSAALAEAGAHVVDSALAIVPRLRELVPQRR